MKTPTQLIADIGRRLTNRWHTDVTAELNDDLDSGPHAFPHAFPLGRPTKAELDANYSRFHDLTVEWTDWATATGTTLEFENRTAKRSTQRLPTHLRIDTIDHAAAILANGWPERLYLARTRLNVIHERYPHIAEHANTIRLLDKYKPLDFDILLTVTDWYLQDPTRATRGVTPRQVPLPGVHAKWLQDHTAGVRALTGIDNLGLLPPHPARVHFTYLDPKHRSTGGRWHDSATVGDPFAPAYEPRIVVISENKDTAIHFPPIPGGISVEGAGYGGGTTAALPWLIDTPHLYYWGDIDAHGYEILNGFRQAGLPVTSILMDLDAYDTYQRYGTNADKSNNLIRAQARKPLLMLTDQERGAYERVTSPEWVGHRRIEQERIPLEIARNAIKEHQEH